MQGEPIATSTNVAGTLGAKAAAAAGQSKQRAGQTYARYESASKVRLGKENRQRERLNEIVASTAKTMVHACALLKVLHLPRLVSQYRDILAGVVQVDDGFLWTVLVQARLWPFPEQTPKP